MGRIVAAKPMACQPPTIKFRNSLQEIHRPMLHSGTLWQHQEKFDYIPGGHSDSKLTSGRWHLLRGVWATELWETVVRALNRMACATLVLGLGLAAVAVGAQDMQRHGRTGDNPASGIASAVSMAGPYLPLAQEPADGRMRGRMSPEERRRLRQDISGANRNIELRDKPGQPKPPR